MCKCLLVAITKNTKIIANIMDALIHFTSSAKFTYKTPQQTLTNGGSGIIPCSALGNPAPQFEWSRNDGRDLEFLRFTQLANGSLRIRLTRREDSGSYICTIKQSRGSDSVSEKSQSINVRVLGKKRKNILLVVLKHQYNQQSDCGFG